MDYQISYSAKKNEEEIIEDTLPAQLETIETIGTESSSNLLVKGDNLPVLKSLMSDYEGKIDLIYIDPPYSTKRVFKTKDIWYQDSVTEESNVEAYQDKLNGAEYLEYLRERLVFLKALLSEKGTIYIHLDEKHAFSVKVLMDEIFGQNKFRNWVTRRKCSSKNYTRNKFGNITDYIMIYSKTDSPIWNRPFREWNEESADKEYPRIEKDSGRRFKQVPIYAQGKRNGATGEPWRGMNPPKGKHWFTSPENLDKLDEEGRIYWSPNGNPRKKVYLDESEGIPYTDLWMDFRDAHNQNVSVTGYPTEKNLDMLKMIIQASSEEDSIILDCFAGSGTTLSAATELNRQWIGIDSSDVAIKTIQNRLKEYFKNNERDLFDKKKIEGFKLIQASIKNSVTIEE